MSRANLIPLNDLFPVLYRVEVVPLLSSKKYKGIAHEHSPRYPKALFLYTLAKVSKEFKVVKLYRSLDGVRLIGNSWEKLGSWNEDYGEMLKPPKASKSHPCLVEKPYPTQDPCWEGFGKHRW